jgi:hypothetical protein
MLWRFDANTGAERGRVMLAESGGGESFARIRGGSSAVVQRPDFGPLFVNDAGSAQELPSLGFIEYRALALSPDASMFARAQDGSIQLTSTRSLGWLSPAMPASLPWIGDGRSDHATHLVFSPDGNRIIGRSRRGWWLTWNVAPDARPSEQLVDEATLLSPGPSTSSGISRPALTPAQRQALRAQDPGPPDGYATADPKNTVPARRADAPPNTVDLGHVFTQSMRGEAADSVEDEFPEFAPGMHRFLGVDYDVRGQVVLLTATHGVDRSRSRVEGIRTGIPRFDALHLLVSGYGSLRRREATPLAFVEIMYRDGSRARLPIIYLKDVDLVDSAENAKPGSESARVAWRATTAGTPRVYKTIQKIYAVRLVNPEPRREVASLALEAADEDGSVPVFFAITLESAEFPTHSSE